MSELLTDEAIELAERTAEDSDVPLGVTDPDALRRVAVLLRIPHN